MVPSLANLAMALLHGCQNLLLLIGKPGIVLGKDRQIFGERPARTGVWICSKFPVEEVAHHLAKDLERMWVLRFWVQVLSPTFAAQKFWF